MRTPITLLIASFLAIALAGAASAGDIDESLNSLHLELKDKLDREIERDVSVRLVSGPAAAPTPRIACDLTASHRCGPQPERGHTFDAVAIIDPDPVPIP